jgi:Mg-chelatase subunit ChlD
MEQMLADNPDVTRCVIFSDGEATDGTLYLEGQPKGYNLDRSYVVEKFVGKEIKVDTVFITDNFSKDRDHEVLKEIARRTGGEYLKFSDSGTFAKAFKYLAPAFRGYLADPNFKKQIGAE